MHDEFFEIGLHEAKGRNDALSESHIRAAGSTAGWILHAGAEMADEAHWLYTRLLAASFLDTAAGPDLYRLAADRYGVNVKGSSAAVVTFQLNRTGTDAVVADAGTIVRDADGTRFSFDGAVFWAQGDTTEKTITATAVGVGPEGNVDADSSWVIETSLADTTITVANAEPAAGGNLVERDDQIRSRSRSARSAIAGGTLRAIEYGALQVDQVRVASATEVYSNGFPTGFINLVVADDDGNSNSALLALVTAEMLNWAPAGAYMIVTGGTPRLEDITATAVWEPGQATTSNRLALEQAIRARVNQLVARAAAAGADAQVEEEAVLDPDVITEVRPLVPGLRRITVNVPVGRIEPDFGEVIRAGTITIL